MADPIIAVRGAPSEIPSQSPLIGSVRDAPSTPSPIISVRGAPPPLQKSEDDAGTPSPIISVRGAPPPLQKSEDDAGTRAIPPTGAGADVREIPTREQLPPGGVRLTAPSAPAPTPTAPEPPPGIPRSPWYAQAVKTAQAFGIPVPLFLGLVTQESGWNPKAVSKAGAFGLTQLMPETVRGLGVDPQQVASKPGLQLLYGALYLRRLHDDLTTRYPAMDDRTAWKMALAAYNGGYSRVIANIDKGAALPTETHNYVEAVDRLWNKFARALTFPGVTPVVRQPLIVGGQFVAGALQPIAAIHHDAVAILGGIANDVAGIVQGVYYTLIGDRQKAEQVVAGHVAAAKAYEKDAFPTVQAARQYIEDYYAWARAHNIPPAKATLLLAEKIPENVWAWWFEEFKRDPQLTVTNTLLLLPGLKGFFVLKGNLARARAIADLEREAASTPAAHPPTGAQGEAAHAAARAATSAVAQKVLTPTPPATRPGAPVGATPLRPEVRVPAPQIVRSPLAEPLGETPAGTWRVAEHAGGKTQIRVVQSPGTLSPGLPPQPTVTLHPAPLPEPHWRLDPPGPSPRVGELPRDLQRLISPRTGKATYAEKAAEATAKREMAESVGAVRGRSPAIDPQSGVTYTDPVYTSRGPTEANRPPQGPNEVKEQVADALTKISPYRYIVNVPPELRAIRPILQPLVSALTRVNFPGYLISKDAQVLREGGLTEEGVKGLEAVKGAESYVSTVQFYIEKIRRFLVDEGRRVGVVTKADWERVGRQVLTPDPNAPEGVKRMASYVTAVLDALYKAEKAVGYVYPKRDRYLALFFKNPEEIPTALAKLWIERGDALLPGYLAKTAGIENVGDFLQTYRGLLPNHTPKAAFMKVAEAAGKTAEEAASLADGFENELSKDLFGESGSYLEVGTKISEERRGLITKFHHVKPQKLNHALAERIGLKPVYDPLDIITRRITHSADATATHSILNVFENLGLLSPVKLPGYEQVLSVSELRPYTMYAPKPLVEVLDRYVGPSGGRPLWGIPSDLRKLIIGWNPIFHGRTLIGAAASIAPDILLPWKWPDVIRAYEEFRRLDPIYAEMKQNGLDVDVLHREFSTFSGELFNRLAERYPWVRALATSTIILPVGKAVYRVAEDLLFQRLAPALQGFAYKRLKALLMEKDVYENGVRVRLPEERAGRVAAALVATRFGSIPRSMLPLWLQKYGNTLLFAMHYTFGEYASLAQSGTRIGGKLVGGRYLPAAVSPEERLVMMKVANAINFRAMVLQFLWTNSIQYAVTGTWAANNPGYHKFDIRIGEKIDKRKRKGEYFRIKEYTTDAEILGYHLAEYAYQEYLKRAGDPQAKPDFRPVVWEAKSKSGVPVRMLADAITLLGPGHKPVDFEDLAKLVGSDILPAPIVNIFNLKAGLQIPRDQLWLYLFGLTPFYATEGQVSGGLGLPGLPKGPKPPSLGGR
jgi:hypothetical protein